MSLRIAKTSPPRIVSELLDLSANLCRSNHRQNSPLERTQGDMEPWYAWIESLPRMQGHQIPRPKPGVVIFWAGLEIKIVPNPPKVVQMPSQEGVNGVVNGVNGGMSGMVKDGKAYLEVPDDQITTRAIWKNGEVGCWAGTPKASAARRY